jgi:transglutaminase-like putative cysteine protease
MKLQVYHRTHYRYAAPVRESFNEARLRPVTADGQVCQTFMLKVLPATRLSHHLDFLNNYVHVFDVSEPHAELMVEATSTVITSGERVLDPDQPSTPLTEMRSLGLKEGCHDFLQPSRFVDPADRTLPMAEEIAAGLSDAWAVAQNVMRHVHRDFEYKPASTHVHTPMSEVIANHCGVCQDFAHVTIGLCRTLGIPARYVSGYLYNGPVDQLRGAQASHAWVEVYLPQLGWRGLDPTNGQQPDDRYVKIATGRDYSDVSPLRGTYRGTPQRKMTVDVLVSALEQRAA